MVKLFPDIKLSSNDAGIFCQNMGASLLVMETLEEFTLIKNIILSSEGMYPTNEENFWGWCFFKFCIVSF